MEQNIFEKKIYAYSTLLKCTQQVFFTLIQLQHETFIHFYFRVSYINIQNASTTELHWLPLLILSPSMNKISVQSLSELERNLVLRINDKQALKTLFYERICDGGEWSVYCIFDFLKTTNDFTDRRISRQITVQYDEYPSSQKVILHAK